MKKVVARTAAAAAAAAHKGHTHTHQARFIIIPELIGPNYLPCL